MFDVWEARTGSKAYYWIWILFGFSESSVHHTQSSQLQYQQSSWMHNYSTNITSTWHCSVGVTDRIVYVGKTHTQTFSQPVKYFDFVCIKYANVSFIAYMYTNAHHLRHSTLVTWPINKNILQPTKSLRPRSIIKRLIDMPANTEIQNVKETSTPLSPFYPQSAQ